MKTNKVLSKTTKTKRLLFFIISIMLMIASCGNDSHTDYISPVTDPNWIIATSADISAEEDLWNSCGGAILCTVIQKDPQEPDTEHFYGSGSDVTVQCYKSKGSFMSITKSEKAPDYCQKPH